MNCEQVKELLSAYLDTMLAAEEQRAVATHLELCSHCRASLADFRHFDHLLSQLPRVMPDPSLRQKIFSSPDYLELLGNSISDTKFSEMLMPHRSVPTNTSNRRETSALLALPGGRLKAYSSSPEGIVKDPFAPSSSTKRSRAAKKHLGQRILQGTIAATLLLALGVGGLISWTLWQRQTAANNTTAIMPPASLQQGPIPAGLRFLFLRNGTLWSASSDGSNTILRLTPKATEVAAQWAVKPRQTGHNAGNIVAYIDLKQGFVHLVRSDGQNDIIIQQPLLKHGVQPSTLWDSPTGVTILSSLTWSNDGNKLAFMADPTGTAQPALYLYTVSTNILQKITFSPTGAVSHPVWSPDSMRIAFVVTQNGNSLVHDYNTQNQDILTLQSGISAQANGDDTIQSLKWSPDSNTPALTWSIGQAGDIHSVWIQHVGVGSGMKPTLLANGNYTQVDYNPAGHAGIGSWLLVTNGDIISVDLSALATKLTIGKQVHIAQWSPDGNTIDYFGAFSHGMGIFHLVNVSTGTDTLIAQNVTEAPLPAWSSDSQHVAYSTGVHTMVIDLHAPGAVQTLKQQGKAAGFSWSVATPSQLVLATEDGQQGLYLIDIQHETEQSLSKESVQGSLQWTQIP